MGEFLWLFWFYASAFLILAANGFFLYQLCRPFITFRRGRFGKVLSTAFFSISCAGPLCSSGGDGPGTSSCS